MEKEYINFANLVKHNYNDISLKIQLMRDSGMMSIGWYWVDVFVNTSDNKYMIDSGSYYLNDLYIIISSAIESINSKLNVELTTTAYQIQQVIHHYTIDIPFEDFKLFNENYLKNKYPELYY
jgi:hypothetical protein